MNRAKLTAGGRPPSTDGGTARFEGVCRCCADPMRVAVSRCGLIRLSLTQSLGAGSCRGVARMIRRKRWKKYFIGENQLELL